MFGWVVNSVDPDQMQFCAVLTLFSQAWVYTTSVYSVRSGLYLQMLVNDTEKFLIWDFLNIYKVVKCILKINVNVLEYMTCEFV